MDSIDARVAASPVIAPAGTSFAIPPPPTSFVRESSTSAGRPPRSRRSRPCDRCRRAKARCTIDASGPPCLLCAEGGRPCTFDAAPPPRKPRASTNAPSEDPHEEVSSPRGSASRRGRSSRSESVLDDRRSQSPDRGRDPSPNPSSAQSTRHRRLSPTELSSFDNLAKSDRYDAHGEHLRIMAADTQS